MQILPLQSSSAQTAVATGLSTSSEIANRQTALFASLLNGSTTTTSGDSSGTASTSSAAASTIADPVTAAATPSEQDLMKLPLTKEDLAALHDQLKEQGFSDDELAAMDQRVESESGMTWGEMMTEVKKKVSTTEKSEKKEISNDDKVQMLGLFGKLGFTPTESQNMVDALSRGETQSVMAAVNEKVAGLASDSTVSLDSSEITALGRNMNLSTAAQTRLATLVDQSGAAQGLSTQGITTAMSLVKNELLAQVGQENQALSDFRQEASKVLTQAWQRESGKKNSDIHQDDVAIKAAQVVAMGAGKGHQGSDVPTASQAGVDVLADVPKSATDASKQVAKGVDDKAVTVGTGTGHTAQAGTQTAQTSDSKATSAAAAELTGRAGPVAAEQALASGQTKDGASGPQLAEGEMAKTVMDKRAVAASQGAKSESGTSTGGQPQGGTAGGSFGQTGQEEGFGEFWNKVRTDKTIGTTATTAQGATSQTLPGLNAAKTGVTTQSAKTYDPALAARVAKQLETGILRNVGDAKQLTIKLSPDDLGKLNVTLTVKDKEVRAVISAEDADTAAMLQNQSAHIKQTLESQGFKVTKLDVQTGLPQDNQSTWQNPEQHNQAREQREAMERIRTSVRLARDASGTIADLDNTLPEAMAARAAGLDLFA